MLCTNETGSLRVKMRLYERSFHDNLPKAYAQISKTVVVFILWVANRLSGETTSGSDKAQE